MIGFGRLYVEPPKPTITYKDFLEIQKEFTMQQSVFLDKQEDWSHDTTDLIINLQKELKKSENQVQALSDLMDNLLQRTSDVNNCKNIFFWLAVIAEGSMFFILGYLMHKMLS